MIRVLVVDDSGFMRVAIRKMIETESDISVIGEARDGSAAIQLVKDLDPDIITMDVEMAGMDGITAARTIMQQCPRPIIMVSSITQTGASATVEALKAGAVDFISKSSSFVSLDIVKIEKELKEKIRVHARKAGVLGARPAARPMAFATPGQNPVPRPAVLPAAMTRTPSDLVVIGVSTGGPRMLPDMLKAMGVPRQPVVVAQHMPPLFTKSFADHLTQDTGIPVFEGVDGSEAKPGTVLILEGGADFILRRGGNGGFVCRKEMRPNLPVHPSVDVLFTSAATAARYPVGVILTGMGSDGTEGAREFHRRGFAVLVQEPATCVVDGMPSSALSAGVATSAMTLDALGRCLARWGQ